MIIPPRVDQSNSIVWGDQVAGDKITFELVKELATASVEPIRSPMDLDIDDDSKSTVLLKKLKDGKCNLSFIQHAIRSKINSLTIVIRYSDTSTGKQILSDVYSNLISIINLKYISQLNEGESLIIRLGDVLSDLSSLCTKYKGQINIDEAFLEGLLYIATSKCAIRWLTSGGEDFE